MSAATAMQKCITEATNKADDLSLKLLRITQIVKLAAFASEARRVLESIDRTATHSPDFRKTIEDGCEGSQTWAVLDDVCGSVLGCVADELEELNGEFTETVHGLARVKKNGGAA
jgi:hypothetical protein